MANSGVKDDNSSQFFFTLDSCPELQNKHTIFGKVTGNTIYNMIKLEESEVDQNERPLFPHKIYSTQILSNPFPEIIPRSRAKTETKVETKPKSKATKNFSLLSFGDEAEEEEEQDINASKEFRGKSKSSHDLLKNDPKLSSVPAIEPNLLNDSSSEEELDIKVVTEESDEKKSQRLDTIRGKLKKETKSEKSEDYEDRDEDEFFESERKARLKDKEEDDRSNLSKVKDEFQKLKRQMCSELKKRYEKPSKCKSYENPAVAEFVEEAKKYKEAATSLPKKGVSREQLCLSLLEKFKSRLLKTRERKLSENNEEDKEDKGVKDDSDWLSHQMHCQKEEDSVLAKDANLRNEEDWYDIYDPRNPINKRRREEGLEGKPKKGRVN